MNKTDIQLKQDIDDELRFDPRLNAAQIGVVVERGAVALKGEVDSYAEKWAVDAAVKRVSGVRAVAEDLTVKVQGNHRRTDSEIAQAVLAALRYDVRIPSTVTASVREGWITLEGAVAGNYQRESAARALRYLMGVVGVTNSITVEPKASVVAVKEQVQAALKRQGFSEASSIHVATSGGTVTLSGEASSFYAIKDATAAAWAIAGVTQVVDNVEIAGY